MAAEDARRITPSPGSRVVKPSSKNRVPSAVKIRFALRRCLKKNNFDAVEALATFFKNGTVPVDQESMTLLVECFEKMGQKERANICRGLAEKAKLAGVMHPHHPSNPGNNTVNSPPPQPARTSPVTPPLEPHHVQGEAPMDVDMEEGEVEEPLDHIDYLRKLDDIIRKPSLTEEELLRRDEKPNFQRSRNQSQTEMSVSLRLPITSAQWKKEFGPFLIAQGVARMTRQDTHGGDRAFRNARNRAAKQAIDKLQAMCKRVEDEARKNLQSDLHAWFTRLRREEYVDKCYQAFRHARDIIFSSAHDGLYSARVFLYGSATTGLVLGDSDIDVAVAVPLPKSSDDPRYMHAEVLAFLQRAVERKQMKDVELIAKAKVPVLRYYDPDAKIDVDITIASDKSVLLSRLLRMHLKDDVRIWELCMAVKYWARRRRVSGAPRGHINPMGWIIMVIYFLQHHVSPRIGTLYKTKGDDPAQAVIKPIPWRNPKGYGDSTLQTGELLLLFFKFFGYNFDFAHEAISLNIQYPETVEELLRRRHQGPIFIEQPLEHGVNVVDYVKATNMNVVISELRHAYAVCKTSGIGKDLFRTRQKTDEDRIFGG